LDDWKTCRNFATEYSRKYVFIMATVVLQVPDESLVSKVKNACKMLVGVASVKAMAYTVSLSSRFKKDFRRCIKRGLNMKHITDAMDLLEATGMLPAKYRPHKLSGDKDGQWECHIEPDWLMTWEQSDTQLTLLFLQTGTHSDLF
jgi:mRNA interferase YafQ